MKNTLAIGLCAGMVSAASAVSLIDTDFTSPYVNGNIDGQQSWQTMPLSGDFAFQVDATAGVADTAPYAGDFLTGAGTNGHFVYLSPAHTVGNAVDDEWTGSMDFKLSTTAYAGTNIALFGSAHEIFDIGFSSEVTNRLNSGSDGDVTIHLRKKSNGTAQVTLSKNGNFQTLAQLTDEEMGWDPALLNPDNVTADFETDLMHLTWTLRKTRVDSIYSAVAVLSNTVSGVVSVYDDVVNDNSVTKSNVYSSAALTLAMGHHSDADDDGTKSLIHIEIDTLRVEQTSNNAPVLEAPVLSASVGDGVVSLNWSGSFEAQSYEIFRSLTPGSGFSSIGTTNGLSFSDETVVNETVYYYMVEASSSGAATVGSAEVSAQPRQLVTGSIISTDFTAADGYTDATDLAGQLDWLAATNGAPAFQITDAVGSGFADSAPYTANLSTNGNDVYIDKPMANQTGDEWSGSVTFTIKTGPSASQEKIRDISGVAYTNNVAALGGGEIFKIGLTSQPDTGLITGSANDLTLTVRRQTSGRLDFQFNSIVNKERAFFLMDNSIAGWDPNWDDATTGPDYETDPITLNWSIRKSLVSGDYIADCEVVVGGVTYQDGGPFACSAPDLNSAVSVFFGMSVDAVVTKGKDLVTGELFELDNPLTIAVDSLAVSKADMVAPVMTAPENILAEPANYSVALSWDAALDTTGYTVRRYDAATGGAVTVLASNLTERVYVDDDVLNETAYYYTVASEFGSFGEAESDPRVEAIPSAKITVVKWGYSAAIVTGNVNFQPLDSVTSGTIENHLGNEADGAFYSAADGVDTSIAPPVYGILQTLIPTGTDDPFSQAQIREDPVDYIKMNANRGNVNNNFSGLVYLKQSQFDSGEAVDATAGTTSYEVKVNKVSGGTTGQARAAIRNGTSWYASASLLPSGNTLAIADVTAETWYAFTEPTAGSTSLLSINTASPATVTLDNITAVGYVVDNCDQVYIEGMMLITEVVVSGTPVEQWAASYGLSGEDTAADADPDADGLTNLEEWGLAGNPNDINNTGTMPKIEGADEAGTSVLYLYPSKATEPKPTYVVLDRGSLTTGGWVDNSGSYTVTSGGSVEGTSDEYIWVTNAVPSDLGAKFMGLQITE